MNIAKQTLAIFILSFFLQYLFSYWWLLPLVAFLVGAGLHLRTFNSFFSGFLGGFLLWGLYSLFIDWNNSSILSSQIAELFGVSSGFILILITALLAGLVSGLCALTGTFGRSVITPPPPKRIKRYSYKR